MERMGLWVDVFLDNILWRWMMVDGHEVLINLLLIGDLMSQVSRLWLTHLLKQYQALQKNTHPPTYIYMLSHLIPPCPLDQSC
jgi:hypothetical protein